MGFFLTFWVGIGLTAVSFYPDKTTHMKISLPFFSIFSLLVSSLFGQKTEYVLDTIWQNQLPDSFSTNQIRTVFHANRSFSIIGNAADGGFKMTDFDAAGKMTGQKNLPTQIRVGRNSLKSQVKNYLPFENQIFAHLADSAGQNFISAVRFDQRQQISEDLQVIPSSLGLEKLFQISKNEGFVLTGSDASGQAFCAKIGLDGQLVWRQNLGVRKKYTPKFLQNQPDGSFLVAGDVSAQNIEFPMTDVRLMDGAGKQIWNQVLGAANVSTTIDAAAILPDGEILTAGLEGSNFRIAQFHPKTGISFKKILENKNAVCTALAIFENQTTILLIENNGKMTCVRLAKKAVEKINLQLVFQFSDSIQQYTPAEIIKDEKGAATAATWKKGQDFQILVRPSGLLWFYVLNREATGAGKILFASDPGENRVFKSLFLPSLDSSFYLSTPGTEAFFVLAAAQPISKTDLQKFLDSPENEKAPDEKVIRRKTLPPSETTTFSEKFEIKDKTVVMNFDKNEIARFRILMKVME